jgi:ribosomal protein S18 acetylase RimI-like enzyme
MVGPPDLRPYVPELDADWAEGVLASEFAGRMQARRGVLVDSLEGDGFVALGSGERVGLVTWLLDPAALTAEIRVLVVLRHARGRGIGGALLDAALAAIRAAGGRSAWLVTTNDATDALVLYQRHGLRLTALREGAVDEARRTLKPGIGRLGHFGIPIRDELELTTDLRTDRLREGPA